MGRSDSDSENSSCNKLTFRSLTMFETSMNKYNNVDGFVLSSGIIFIEEIVVEVWDSTHQKLGQVTYLLRNKL